MTTEPVSRNYRAAGFSTLVPVIIVCGFLNLQCQDAARPAEKGGNGPVRDGQARQANALDAPWKGKTPRISKHPKGSARLVRLAGTPEEMGRQHGNALAKKIRIMLKEYVTDDYTWQRDKDRLLARVRAMKPSVPGWYLRELAACAKAAGVDEDVLLFAQCEGDIKSLGGCTTYVAFGKATAGGEMEIGRSFDYWGLESTDACVVVLAFIPRPEDGHAFVAVGWAGILGGWTLLNEKGIFVANNLGGFTKKNPKGIPTLILERIIAQKASTLDEAIKLVKSLPRMRGQALIMAQVGGPKPGDAPDAAVVFYDAEQVEVVKQERGFIYHSSAGTSEARLRRLLKDAKRKPMDVIRSAGNYITLHSVAIRPWEKKLWVAHGRRSSAHLGTYVKYDLRELLRR